MSEDKTKNLELVSFEQAKKLKKLGFAWEVSDFYWDTGELDELENQMRNCNAPEFCSGEVYSAPTVALALKWFRDTKGCVFDISIVCTDRGKFLYKACIIKPSKDDKGNVVMIHGESSGNYEEVESALLDELIEIC